MVILIAGASHTGKTYLAQKLLEKHRFPYISIDHLKMGLIRCGNTDLTPESPDEELTDLLWPIVKEIIKTAIENEQNLIVEGCYIPFDWKTSFEEVYLPKIRYICLVMSKNYIATQYEDIKKYENVVEHRLDDSCCSMESLLADNQRTLEMCQKYKNDYWLIDTAYALPF